MAQPSKRALLALKQARAAHGFARQQEAIYYELVLAALRSVARRFTDLIADGKPVDPAELAHIKTLWTGEVPDLAEAAAAVYQSAGNALGRPLGGSITQQMRTAYLRNTAQRLTDVGDGLWDAATKSLSEGVIAGEDYAQLTDRLLGLFEADGEAVSESKAGMITRSTVASAVNGGSTDAMRQSDAAPTYRVWICTADFSTRDSHFEADGQVVTLDAPFIVGGEELDYPGDESASIELWANCRCTTAFVDEPVEIPLAGRGFRSDEEIADVEDFFAERGVERTPGLLTAAAGEVHTQGMIALIPSDKDAARLAVDGGEPVADLHVTLMFLGEVAAMDEPLIAALRDAVAEAGTALVQPDAEAFAVSWFNPTGDQPCWVLGINGEGIGTAHDFAGQAVSEAVGATGSEWECPEQHPVFVPHLTCIYSDDPGMVDVLAERVGPVRFDRLRLALAGDNYDVPLTGGTVSAMTDAHAAEFAAIGDALAEGIANGTPAVVAAGEAVVAAAIMEPDVVFTTARIRALTLLDVSAFVDAWIQLDGEPDADGFAPWSGVATQEDTPTGDGRFYATNCFRWEDGSQPFQWDIEDDGGHLGAVCIGRVDEYVRDGANIRARGVIDTTIPAGEAARHLIERGILKWVSVVMDDIPEDTVEYPNEPDIGDAPDMEDPLLIEAGATLAAPLLFPVGTPLADVAAVGARLVAANIEPALDMTAAASGAADLPLADEGTEWDPNTAHADLVAAATDADGVVDVPLVARGCLWLPGTPDGTEMDNPDSYQLPFAQIIDGTLTAVPAGIDWASAEAIRLNETGDMPDEDLTAISDVLTDYYQRMSADDGTELLDEELEASAWAEFRQMPVLPAALFAEPDLADVNEYVHVDAITAAGGETYRRISGWVGQNGVCHDAFSECVNIPLAGTDLATFNRQPITLDDGTTIRAGAFTMNAGHNNDGASAASMRAQFDDTRTVAGIVTVGLKADGSGCWFSGVMAPWLSEWDTQVLAACRPSGHWKRTSSGGYSLRAVLSVPVPGFPNRVAASAVVERSNFALVASAAMAEPADAPVTDWGKPGIAIAPEGMALLASAIVDEIESRAAIRAEVEELSASLNDERKLVASTLNGSE